MNRNTQIGEIFLELEQNMGEDKHKNLLVLQKMKKQIGKHPEADIINDYMNCRQDELLGGRSAVDNLLDPVDQGESDLLKAQLETERKAGHTAEMIEILSSLIEKTKDDYMGDMGTLFKKEFVSEFSLNPGEEFVDESYSVAYIYERFKLRKALEGFDAAYKEVLSLKQEMPVSSPYNVLLAKCLYGENRKAEAWKALDRAFEIFVSQGEVAEIYLTAATFLKAEEKPEAYAAALVAGHAWEPENPQITACAASIDLEKLLKGKNIKSLLLSNRVPPMPEIACCKRMAEYDGSDVYPEDMEEDLRFTMKNIYQPVFSYSLALEDLLSKGAVYKALPAFIRALRLKKVRGEENAYSFILLQMISDPSILTEYERISSLPEKERFVEGKKWLQLLESTFSIMRNRSYIFECAAETALFRAYFQDDLAEPGYNMAGYFAYMLAETCLAMEQYDKMPVYIEKLEDYFPANSDIKRLIAHSFALQGKRQKALETFSTALFLAVIPEQMAFCYGEIASLLCLENDMQGACAALVAGHAWDPAFGQVNIMMENFAGMSDFTSVRDVRDILKEREIPDKPESQVIKAIKSQIAGISACHLADEEEMLAVIDNLKPQISFRRSLNDLLRERKNFI